MKCHPCNLIILLGSRRLVASLTGTQREHGFAATDPMNDLLQPEVSNRAFTKSIPRQVSTHFQSVIPVDIEPDSVDFFRSGDPGATSKPDGEDPFISTAVSDAKAPPAGLSDDGERYSCYCREASPATGPATAEATGCMFYFCRRGKRYLNSLE